jgi:succinate dehydrogenase / fumarate reductase cytochrome b subunit
MMMSNPPRAERPLSPHLQIYRPMLTMMMSIVHRATGLALAAGAVLLVIWLLAAASSEAAYAAVQAFLGSWFGRLLLFGFTWALIHHAAGGIRHLVWDTGRGFELATVERGARLVLGFSLAATVFLWMVGYWVKP